MYGVVVNRIRVDFFLVIKDDVSGKGSRADDVSVCENETLSVSAMVYYCGFQDDSPSFSISNKTSCLARLAIFGIE